MGLFDFDHITSFPISEYESDLQVLVNLTLIFTAAFFVAYAYNASGSVKDGNYLFYLKGNIISQAITVVGRLLIFNAAYLYDGSSEHYGGCYPGKILEFVGFTLSQISSVGIVSVIYGVVNETISRKFDDYELFRKRFMAIVIFINSISFFTFFPFNNLYIYFKTYCYHTNSYQLWGYTFGISVLVNILICAGFIIQSTYLLATNTLRAGTRSVDNGLEGTTSNTSVRQQVSKMHLALIKATNGFSLSYLLWNIPFWWSAFRVAYLKQDTSALDTTLLHLSVCNIITDCLVFVLFQNQIIAFKGSSGTMIKSWGNRNVFSKDSEKGSTNLTAQVSTKGVMVLSQKE